MIIPPDPRSCGSYPQGSFSTVPRREDGAGWGSHPLSTDVEDVPSDIPSAPKQAPDDDDDGRHVQDGRLVARVVVVSLV